VELTSSRDGGRRSSPPRALIASKDGLGSTPVVLAVAGRIYVLYQRIGSSSITIECLRSPDDGARFEGPVPVGTAGEVALPGAVSKKKAGPPPLFSAALAPSVPLPPGQRASSRTNWESRRQSALHPRLPQASTSAICWPRFGPGGRRVGWRRRARGPCPSGTPAARLLGNLVAVLCARGRHPVPVSASCRRKVDAHCSQTRHQSVVCGGAIGA
jgi:hypothetical protein